jgi:hypothetical protein
MRPPESAAASEYGASTYRRFKFSKADPSQDMGPQVNSAAPAAGACCPRSMLEKATSARPSCHTTSGSRPSASHPCFARPDALPAARCHLHVV